MTRAVVLVSGGMDSATTLAMAAARGFACHALSFDYGQRHRHELEAAARVAAALGAEEHVVLKVGLAAIGGSALTNDIAVPKDRVISPDEVPVTYVPARNTIFLSLALGYAEAIQAFELFYGANAVDYSGYPDCRPAFVSAFEHLANVATGAAVEGRGRFRVHAPLMHMNKAEIVRRGVDLGVDFSLTHTCYDPEGDASCGRCDACRLRLAGFAAAGLEDPLPYVQP